MMTKAYTTIAARWVNKTDSKGSPYMWHIDMGIAYLKTHNASQHVIDAWCIHPLIQDFKDLKENQSLLTELSPESVLFAVEYRHQANWYSTHSKHSTKPRVSLLPEVSLMLKADKLQNYWNLTGYRQDHPNYKWLVAYFSLWFTTLEVSTSEILATCDLFNKVKNDGES